MILPSNWRSQVIAFLSLSRKKVWGIDFSESSLRKAELLKEKLHLDTLVLKQADVLNLDIKEKFDFALCLGVLHRTANPYKGFENIVKLLNPGGYVILGLYNKYGRKILQLRRILLHTIFLNSQKVKEYFIKKQISNIEDKIRTHGWYKDQYEHPHETTHTVEEILEWFRKNNIEYVNSIPT